MNRPDLHALLGMAPAYAVGTLDGADLVSFEVALPDTPGLQEEVDRYRALLGAFAESHPRRSLPSGLKGRLMRRIRLPGLDGHPVAGVDFEELDWSRPSHAPGVEVHVLREEGGTQTVLLRAEPGTAYPDHRHPGGESFFVLEGSFRDHRAEYHAGDFHRFPPGSEHRSIRITGGTTCVTLIVTGPGGTPLLEDR